MKKLLISLIEFYQTCLSFDRGLFRIFAPTGACRYEVSCSQYTKEAIENYGVIKGMNLGLKRIWSCR